MTSAETIVIVTTVTVPTLDATFLAFKKRDLEPRGVNDLAPRILRNYDSCYNYPSLYNVSSQKNQIFVFRNV